MLPIERRRTFTPKEYLQLERSADYRSEYFNGEIFAMAGASRNHNKIGFNLKGVLFQQLKGGVCGGYDTDMRIAVDPLSAYTYADATVVFGEPHFLDEPTRDNLANPAAIFEILSPSTENYDRGQKFDPYKHISSLTDYVLVSQDRPRVEHFHREGDGWVLREYEGLGAAVELDSIGCRLPLLEIYLQVFGG